MVRKSGYTYVKMKKKYEFCDKKALKCVLVGDSGVGKSSVAARLSSRGFKPEYLPTLFDNYAATVKVDEQPFHVSLFDTAGKDDYDRLRVLAYINCDVFLVCFSVIDLDSLKSVEAHWVPELRHYLPNCPFILVGTKIDQRSQQNSNGVVTSRIVSFKEAAEVADRIGAASYVECSALTEEGMEDVTREAIETVQRAEHDCIKGKKGRCCRCPIL